VLGMDGLTSGAKRAACGHTGTTVDTESGALFRKKNLDEKKRKKHGESY